jgi:hypothetical protein
MSASERLKALDVRLKESPWLYEPNFLALRDALPQIVAVVEAAENYREEFALRGVQTRESGQAWRDLQAALSALEEALS